MQGLSWRASWCKQVVVSGRSLTQYAVFLCLALLLQWWRGDWGGQWTDYQDEASHFITGLMVHDYLRHHLFENPMRFATTYYEHYQKVAMGHWPPVFYVVQGLWYFVVPPSLLSALSLMATISATVAYFIADEVRRFAPRFATAAGILWLVLPVVRSAGEKVYSELLVVLFSFLALRVYARYLEDERWTQSLLFGLFASAAIMTKATGLSLAFVPVLSAIIARAPSRFRRVSFWLPLGAVVLFCLPWYLTVPGARHERFMLYGGPGWRSYRLVTFFSFLGNLFVFPLWLGLLAASAKSLFFLKQWDFLKPAIGLAVGTVIGTTVIAVWEPRHIINLGPPLVVVLAFAAHHWLSELPSNFPSRALYAAYILAIGLCLVRDRPPDRSQNDYREIAAIAHAFPIVLVAGYTDCEGGITSEYAILEAKRPSGTVLRASKVISESDMVGTSYKMKLSTTQQIYDYLQARGVRLVVVDEKKGGSQPEVAAMRTFLRAYSNEWVRVDTNCRRVAVYKDVRQSK